MKTEIQKFLPEEAHNIRIKVFIEEQGFENEFDEIDAEAVHILMKTDDGMPVATCRVFWSEEMNSYVLGRLAVLKEYRGRGMGSEIVREALDYVKSAGGKTLMLHSQCRAKSFYENLGFTAFGEVELDEGCPHIWMKKGVV
ncbi:MAG: GNAT family N-acetyltransferase [Clostridia bacterium]|nr:GNAT family N-acetyltransferase [Clostridia bacterium]